MNYHYQIREILDRLFVHGFSSQEDLPEERAISVQEAFEAIVKIVDDPSFQVWGYPGEGDSL